jgi:hypothetical protein
MGKVVWDSRIKEVLSLPRNIGGVPCYLVWMKSALATQPSLVAISVNDAEAFPTCAICGFRYADNCVSNVEGVCETCEHCVKQCRHQYLLVVYALRGGRLEGNSDEEVA